MMFRPHPRLCLWGHHRHDLTFTLLAPIPPAALTAKALARALINWRP